jgi:hypothetical protein
MTSQPADQPAANSNAPLSWQHAVTSVGARGVIVDRKATEAELSGLKTELGVISVESFEARYAITAQSGRSYLMTGDFTARLTQACVVTLEPVAQNISETFSVSFCPPGRISEPEEKERPVLDAPDIEVLSGDSIQAGRVLFELLSAALDPYPRKGEAEFSWQDPKTDPQDIAILHPFSALSKLKNDN